MIVELTEIFSRLNDAEVRYLVVGGVATVLHGYGRLTADLDLMVALETENARKAIEVLLRAGFRPRVPVDPYEFADNAKRSEWITSKGLVVFTMTTTAGLPFNVDLFVDLPQDFERMWSERVLKQVGDLMVPVVNVIDLIEMKRSVGRNKDLEDVSALEIINEQRQDRL